MADSLCPEAPASKAAQPEGSGPGGAAAAEADGPGLFGELPAAPTPAAAATGPAPAYRVLARKYRPDRFEHLIGQEALVRTLRNAIATGRIAHAFMLTGVRGVGKTTTARILARALNCVGEDGQGGATITPCGLCPNCRAIAEDRHPDVIEMDAASRTGVEDIREVIEGVRYRPTMGRYKVYIVDEVHMLSKNAFNALLKTLEEPPAHVKFIFATTEIRKVPVTVLSRCQRFDLRRIGQDELARHFADIAAKEAVRVAPAAIELIARAADGSVRDGLSLLDQAIAQAGEDAAITAERVRDMLGLADRLAVFDLFEALMAGRIDQALALAADQHARGADPATMIEDLLELTHTLTRLRAVPDLAQRGELPEAEAVRGAALAARLPMPALARAWQVLLKGLAEVRSAPDAQAAAEMVLIRLAYAADLPTPADLVRILSGNGGGAASGGGASGSNGGGNGGGGARAEATRMIGGAEGAGAPVRAQLVVNGPGASAASAGAARPAPATQAQTQVQPLADPQDFAAVLALLQSRREGRLSAELYASVRLVHFEPGRIEFNPLPTAPRDLASRLSALLQEATGRRWVIAVSSAPGAPTLAAQEQAAEQAKLAEARGHPLVQAVLAAFPGARLEAVRPIGQAAAPPPTSPDAPAQPAPAAIEAPADLPDFAPPDAELADAPYFTDDDDDPSAKDDL
ncbi:MAG: DNA polymerase III subunit gamma/tau [Alphaproteobacteria bacterium]|nr:DNA polymerase III subunit gamma/tau [Alphaproteobacteria bacterium]